MLRVLLTPRWVALTLLLVAAVAVCGRLGVWQWDRAHPEVAHDPAREATSSLPAVLDRPDGGAEVPAGALVRASGTWVDGPDATTRVSRPLDGEPGTWVLTPLRLDDGREVTVLRGWAPRGGEVAPPTADAVVVTGRLEPAGADPDVDGMFVALTEQQPAADDGLRPVEFPPAPADAEVRLTNALYAVQWWIFAAFWVYLWWRFFREDVEDARRSSSVHRSATV